MTVENSIRRYKEFVEKGNDKAAQDMKQHMLTVKKFKGHPFLKELGVKVEATPTKEVKKDGKK